MLFSLKAFILIFKKHKTKMGFPPNWDLKHTKDPLKPLLCLLINKSTLPLLQSVTDHKMPDIKVAWSFMPYIFWYMYFSGRSQWPRVLRRRSSATRLLRLWVRIPPGHGCLSVVSVVCCQVEVSATGWSLVQRIPADCGASLCVIKKPWKRGG